MTNIGTQPHTRIRPSLNGTTVGEPRTLKKGRREKAGCAKESLDYRIMAARYLGSLTA